MGQERYYRRSGPSRKGRRLIFIAGSLLLVLAIAYTVSAACNRQSFHNREEWAQQLRLQGPEEQTTYLIYGVDYWGAIPYVERLVLIYRDVNRVKAIYIPGNTLVGQKALGQLYRRGDSAWFVQAVQDYLHLPVNHYLQVYYQGLVDLEKLWGGVEVADLPGSLPELIPEDRQVLGGFELYRYFLTSGHQETALHQLDRQRQILLTLWKKINHRKTWGRKRLFRDLSPYLETDLSWKELQALEEQFTEQSFSEVEMIHLPGAEEVHENRLYWLADQQDINRLIYLLQGEGPAVEEIRVEILNGSGIAGQASGLAEILMEEGLQVVKTGNADHFSYQGTEVISLGETIEAARVVSTYIPGAIIIHQPDLEAEADVRVIIGQDYSSGGTSD